ncbi:Endonuclease III like protein [Cucumispora dikerogammari]|nr:Endonuclease III like protein [Cucumispora dikerogammari]
MHLKADSVLIYKKLKTHRSTHMAPVDILGCHTYLFKSELCNTYSGCGGSSKLEKSSYIERSKQNILTALLLSSKTKDEAVFIAMVNLSDLIQEYKNNNIVNHPRRTTKLTIKYLSALSYEEIHSISKTMVFDVDFNILVNIPNNIINRAINIVGFHNQKTENLKKICRKYKDFLPDSYIEILTLPGIGQKMALLYAQHALNKTYSISVDSHVHRICNLLKIVNTTRVEDTQASIEKIFDKTEWGNINKIFVGYGQTICKKIKPNCHDCPVNNMCPVFKATYKSKIEF